MPKGARTALYVTLALTCLLWGLAFAISAPFRIMPLIAPFPLMALLIIWILPEGDYAPTGALEPLFLAFFASLVLWPNYLAVSLPHLPWLTLLRIFGAPLLLVLLICVSASANFRRDLREVLTSDGLVWKFFAGIVLLQTVSLAFSNAPVLSLNQYIVAQMNWTAIFLVSCYLFVKPGFTERWVWMFLAMVYVVCFMGIWEGAIGEIPWAGHIPPFLKIDADLLEVMLAGSARAALGVHRVQAMQTTPLGMAELLSLAAPFALHIGIGKHQVALRLLALGYLPLALYAILLSDSRLGIVGLISSILAYILIWSALKWRQSKTSLLAPTIVLMYPVILTATILATFFVGRLRQAVWGSGAEQASTDSRLTQWELAIPKVLTHPLGHGIGQAGKEVGYITPTGKMTLDSYYITMLMDLGVVGFLLYFGMFVRAAWIGSNVLIRSRPHGEIALLLPLSVSLLVFIVIKSVLSQSANHPLVFMILGAILALTYRAKREAAAGQPPSTLSITPR